MASQSSSRMRRIASPSTKQGPMKATLTFGLKGTPATAKSCSGPTSSPTSQRAITDSHRKTRRSPDNRASPDRNSPSSPCFKVEKNKPLFQPSIKRTNSLDTIASNWYLKSEWPGLTSEKATQTEEDWDASTEHRKRVSHKRSSSLGNGDNSKELQKIKARLAKTTKEGSRTGVVVAPRASPVPASHLAIISNPVTVTTLHRSKALPVPHIPKPAARVIGSVEGLNQEIEKLVLSTTSAAGSEEIGSTRTREPTPDGHRAPILELLQGGSTSGSSSSTRTVVTQTPSGSNGGTTSGGDIICVSDMKTMLIRVTVDSSGSNSSSRSQSESPSFPIIPGQMDNSRPSSSRSESLDSKEDRAEKDCDSLLFVREPPDGCDKVIVEEPRMAQLECKSFVFCPIKKPEKCRIPSNESAFRICPLYDKYLTQSTEMALKAPPPGGKPGSSPPVLEIQ